MLSALKQSNKLEERILYSFMMMAIMSPIYYLLMMGQLWVYAELNTVNGAHYAGITTAVVILSNFIYNIRNCPSLRTITCTCEWMKGTKLSKTMLSHYGLNLCYVGKVPIITNTLLKQNSIRINGDISRKSLLPLISQSEVGSNVEKVSPKTPIWVENLHLEDDIWYGDIHFRTGSYEGERMMELCKTNSKVSFGLFMSQDMELDIENVKAVVLCSR